MTPPREPDTELAQARQLLAEISVNQDLAELRRLESGWLDGYGEPVSPLAIRSAQQLLVDLVAWGAARPQIGPTPEGGIQAEWSLDDRESSITFEPSGDVYLFSLNVETRETYEQTLSRIDGERVLARIRQLMDGPAT